MYDDTYLQVLVGFILNEGRVTLAIWFSHGVETSQDNRASNLYQLRETSSQVSKTASAFRNVGSMLQISIKFGQTMTIMLGLQPLMQSMPRLACVKLLTQILTSRQIVDEQRSGR